MMRSSLLLVFAVVLAACTGPGRTILDAPEPPPETDAPAPRLQQPPVETVSVYDTVQAGRFDNGRMFTLDDPPLDYFRETYNFTPSTSWFENVQLGALRFATYCSASFVSEDGLILTNHHCARESVTKASIEDGVDYNEDGFYATSLDDEEPIEGLFVEQLISIEDITDEVEVAVDSVGGDTSRDDVIGQIEEERTASAGEGRRVQVVALYAGAQYKAYTYEKYEHVNLVFAPETKIGYFGGDADNFTYPRYALDFSLFRATDEDGNPLQTEHFLPFQPAGTQPGDLVFVVGNPGSTNRLQTVSELEFRRDVTEPALLNFLKTREAVYGTYVETHPEDPLVAEYEDTYFSLGNGRKAYTGRVEGLRDSYIMGRRRAAQDDFEQALAQDSSAQAEYGDVISRIRFNREALRRQAPELRAFMAFSPGSSYNGTAVNRGFVVAPEGVEALETSEIEDQPVDLQVGLLVARLTDFVAFLGEDDSLVQEILAGRSPKAAAEAIVEGSQLVSEGSVTDALASDSDLSSDPAVQFAEVVMPRLQDHLGAVGPSNEELDELHRRLARARFAVYGTEIPPDATFTLRISDGVVKSYEYNGTTAPEYTTFYGILDRYISHCLVSDDQADASDCDWDIPQRWLDARDNLNLSTPYNFVATADIIGGNSGSPVLNRNGEVIGIAFDSNIQALPGDYIFDDTQNRMVSVDVRAMLEALAVVYGMERVAEVLRAGGF